MALSGTRGLLIAASLAALLATACSESQPAAMPAGTPAAAVRSGEPAVTQTASYEIELTIGPAVTMATADLFQDAREGEMMGLMGHMAMEAQGATVNRHLQVHVYRKGGKVGVSDVTPVVTITAQGGGTGRGLPDVRACLLARHKVFPHFGDNLYLRDGRYTVRVQVGNETAAFEVSL